MPATAARIGFITQEYRVATVEDAVTIPGKYGSLARKTTEPLETFFDDIADTAEICAERFALLSADRRRFGQTIQDETFGASLDYEETTPTVTVIDDERGANLDAAVVSFGIDYEQQRSTAITWG